MMMNLLEIVLFYRCKIIFIWQKILEVFLENLTDYFLNIIMNVNFFDDFNFEYYWELRWKTATSQP